MHLDDYTTNPGDYAIGCALVEPQPKIELSLDDKIDALGLDYTVVEDRDVKKATKRHRRDISRHRAMCKAEVRKAYADEETFVKTTTLESGEELLNSVKNPCLSSGEPLRYAREQRGPGVRMIGAQLRRADRQTARRQCLDAMGDDGETVVTGSLLVQRASLLSLARGLS